MQIGQRTMTNGYLEVLEKLDNSDPRTKGRRGCFLVRCTHPGCGKVYVVTASNARHTRMCLRCEETHRKRRY